MADVTWHDSTVDRAARWAAVGGRGATVWFTGLSGSGKSTIAVEVEKALVVIGVPSYLLDGDNLRHGLNADLGFTAEDRTENVRRVAEVARLLADAGLVALAPLISPYAAGRARARRLHEDAGLPFVEVWVSTPLEECERRDTKGLYARARRGEITEMTGIDDPYEPPESPDLELPAHELSVEDATARVLAVLRERNVVD
jgi:bifunctional enzyme CysN/CysC